MFNFSYYYVDQMVGDTSVWPLVVTGLFTLAGVVVGIFLTRWVAKRDKVRKDKKALKDLLTEIELLETPVNNQVGHIDTFIAALKSEKDEVPRFTSILQLQLDRLKALDRSGVIDRLERTLHSRVDAIEMANKLFIGCDAMTHKYEQLQHIVEEYVERGGRIHERWREEANTLLKTAVNYMVEVEQQGILIEDDPLIGRTIELTQRSLKEDNDIFEALKNMHKPLAEHLGTHRLDPRVRSLFEANAKAMQSVLALQREREYAATKLERVKTSMQGLFKKLQEDCRALGAEE